MSSQKPTFTVLVPFFNEGGFLRSTLESWANQTRLPERMLLIDNASTDNSAQIALDFQKSQAGRIDVICLSESRPGKIFALESAHSSIQGEWAVFCDADTFYPTRYLELLEQHSLIAPASTVCLMAIDLTQPYQTASSLTKLWIKWFMSKIFSHKCHTGGFGQTFRVNALNACGGFHSKFWSFVLMDHEIVHRLHKLGSSYYHPDLWCMPSQRRGNRKNVRWTICERLLYFLVPKSKEDWFFYQFLKDRFAKRKLAHLNLRNQPWTSSHIGGTQKP